MRLADEEIFNLTLIEIEKHLQKNRKTLKNYPGMPYPKGFVVEQLGNRLIYEELDYDPTEQLHEFNGLYQTMTGKMYFFLISIHVINLSN